MQIAAFSNGSMAQGQEIPGWHCPSALFEAPANPNYLPLPEKATPPAPCHPQNHCGLTGDTAPGATPLFHA